MSMHHKTCWISGPVDWKKSFVLSQRGTSISTAMSLGSYIFSEMRPDEMTPLVWLYSQMAI